METLLYKLNIYVIPPLLSVIIGWTLAAISVTKGKFRTENILFSFVCIGWTLMPVIFLSHHLFKGNIELIMKVERIFHFLYVFMPAVLLLYLQKAYNLNQKNLVKASFFLSAVISLFVPTQYYISGLHTYKWGYSAKGEIVFIIFGVTAFMQLLYVIWFFTLKVRTVKNYTEALKLKYILLSFIAAAMLMIFNVPAINGIDFYAYGNFMFIPLALIAYGVLRHRLMDIKSVLHITFFWGVISSLILVPNIFLVYYIKPHIIKMDYFTFFILLLILFFLNYLYFKKIKPVIDGIFNKQKFNLLKEEMNFSENISLLKTLDTLVDLFYYALLKNLNFRHASFFIREGEGLQFRNMDGETYQMDIRLYDWFISDEHYLDIDIIRTNPYYSDISTLLEDTFERFSCTYIFPLVRNNEILGFALAAERMNLRSINRNESRFLESIVRSMAVSISNSVMYQKLSDLKDTLEEKVASRTEELLRAIESVEAANKELLIVNEELSERRRISEIDMTMAAHVQKSIFPEIPEDISGWEIDLAFIPASMVSGDLYDFYLNHNELQGAVLFDVSGHGISSGLITMIARSVFSRNFSAYKDLSLGKIVEHANKELSGEIGNTEKYLTGIILRIEESYVEYVNAGHHDIMIRKKNSSNVKIINPPDKDFKGSILGISEMEASYKSAKFKAESGDLIVFFTDGIVEAIGADNSRFGEKGIARGILSAGDTSAEGTLKKIMENFYNFIGDRMPADDITIIVLKKK